MQCVPLTHNDVAPRPILTLPTQQHIPPTLGNVVYWPMPYPLMLQQVPLTHGDIVHPPMLTLLRLQHVPPTHGNIAPRQTLLLPMP
jgi:hypothetical protein